MLFSTLSVIARSMPRNRQEIANLAPKNRPNDERSCLRTEQSVYCNRQSTASRTRAVALVKPPREPGETSIRVQPTVFLLPANLGAHHFHWGNEVGLQQRARDLAQFTRGGLRFAIKESCRPAIVAEHQ
jgi:hypothetical protein